MSFLVSSSICPILQNCGHLLTVYMGIGKNHVRLRHDTQIVELSIAARIKYLFHMLYERHPHLQVSS